jgi:predicted Holliday junction resolvase-like endonuclease
MVTFLTVLFAAVFLGVPAFLYVRLLNTRDKLRETEEELQVTALENESLEQKLRKVTSQKKSSEVRTGLIAEQMAPFLKGFPYDPKKTKFLGQPIDFVAFDDTGVHLVEVKSGKSQLSSVQRRIRNQVKEGNVTFEIYRIEGE